MLNFKGMRFPIDVILVCIRWYVAYPLSYRHIEEMMEEFVNPVLGLAARPDRYPWQCHARELTAHVIYGLVINAVPRFFDRESETTRLTQHASLLMASPFTTDALPDVA